MGKIIDTIARPFKNISLPRANFFPQLAYADGLGAAHSGDLIGSHNTFMVSRSKTGGGLPPRKINLANTLLAAKEQKMMKTLLEETNIMPRTINEIFGAEVEKNDIRNVTFQFHGQGVYRAAYRVMMSIRGLGERETIFKVSHFAFPGFVLHQVLGKIVDPRRDITAATAGIWELPNKKVVMTEEYVVGETFDSYMNRSYAEKFKLAIVTLLMKKCFLFWRDFNHIFISDPHRYQFIVVEKDGKHDIKIIDTGSVATVENVTCKISNNGDVIIKNASGEDIPKLSWIYKVPPRELLQNLIFFLEKPDETAGGDYTSFSRDYEKGYNLPRIAVLDGIMYAFGKKDGSGFLREVQGVDPELDRLALQKHIY